MAAQCSSVGKQRQRRFTSELATIRNSTIAIAITCATQHFKRVSVLPIIETGAGWQSNQYSTYTINS